ncbi:hypothetical protein [Chitinophaga nivalis]|uniref:Uncharacterized protein n=1 Tax=Chitinophaga nivalis TaxID=2991709 RepID=A0ABT3IIS0_9BACT|nr:hypothetical protein [Chitinophaga nivalis]MCW3466493.1 hypothetical protein [Chitinophaga nivalis]MCW3483816.1 hypothetical protein [Chitinophaga nivalis]
MAIIIEFTVGDIGQPSDGETNYYNSVLSGKNVKVFREGIYQYRFGANFIIVSGPGTITFFPPLISQQRIRIYAQ